MSSPAVLSLPSASGTRATRRSPGAVSLATPTFMGTTLNDWSPVGFPAKDNGHEVRVPTVRWPGKSAGRVGDEQGEDEGVRRSAVQDRARPPVQPAEGEAT